MSDAIEDNELCRMTIVVVTRTDGVIIDVNGSATLPALASLQVTITKMLSSNLDATILDEAVLLQGQIVNLALRLAQMFGHAGERDISEG